MISVLSLGRLTKVSQAQGVERDIPRRENRMCKSIARAGRHIEHSLRATDWLEMRVWVKEGQKVRFSDCRGSCK